MYLKVLKQWPINSVSSATACPLAVRLKDRFTKTHPALPHEILCAWSNQLPGLMLEGRGSSPGLSVQRDNLGPTISAGSTLKTGQGRWRTPKLPLAAPCPPPLGATVPYTGCCQRTWRVSGLHALKSTEDQDKPQLLAWHPGRPRASRASLVRPLMPVVPGGHHTEPVQSSKAPQASRK